MESFLFHSVYSFPLPKPLGDLACFCRVTPDTTPGDTILDHEPFPKIFSLSCWSTRSLPKFVKITFKYFYQFMTVAAILDQQISAIAVYFPILLGGSLLIPQFSDGSRKSH